MTTKKETTAKKPTIKKAKAASEEKPKKAAIHEPKGEYLYALGRRKSGTAMVRLYLSGNGTIVVNNKPMKEYFPVEDLQDAIMVPLRAVGMNETADVIAVAHGGGIRGQADAVKLGIARALLVHNPELRATLKPLGVLTRDPREKERKKYGLKKARKSPQWAKR
jgi:small subunit ribosomal protein S9